MPGPKPRPASRYQYDAAVLEIAMMRDRERLQDKDIYLGIGMSQSVFSKKMSGVSTFTVEEFGDIAAFFAGVTGRDLVGWPFVPDALCRVIEARLSPGGTRTQGSSRPGHGS